MSAPEGTCPHCGSMVTDLWDYSWTGEEDEQIETECGACEHPIVIKHRIRHDYAIEALEKRSTTK